MSVLKRRLLLVVAAMIGVVPTSRVRILLYRILFGYRIDWRARLGFGVLIAVNAAIIGKARISRFTLFRGPFDLVIEDGVSIGARNCFTCGEWVNEPRFASRGFLPSCRLGRSVLITDEHFFDTIGGVEIGEASWIAGRGSQFWTHGAGEAGAIRIGGGCYVGSAVRFAPGASVADHSLVGIGSVVIKAFETPYVFIAGVPARVIRADFDWRKRNANDASKSMLEGGTAEGGVSGSGSGVVR